MPKATKTDLQLSCSFCSKRQKDVEKLIAGPGVYICDECVRLCNEIMTVGGPPRVGDDLSDQSEEELVEALVRVRDLHAGVDRAVQGMVRELRRRDVSWARIGEALGMTRQSAWERFSGEE
jgi:hypothetical protein